MRIYKLNDYAAELALAKEISVRIATALQKYSEKGILTVLAINPAAVILQIMALEKKYTAILKPIFIKIKSSDDAFIRVTEDYLKIINESMVDKFQLIPLCYPVAHLLKQLDLGVKEIIKVENQSITLKNPKTGEVFIARFTSTEQINAENIREFLTTNLELSLQIFKEDGNDDRVLADANRNFVIADLDIHCIAEYLPEKTNSPDYVYDTSWITDRKKLADDLIEFRKTKTDPILPTIISDIEFTEICRIPSTMGRISLRDYLLLYWINKECGRSTSEPLKMIFQHGPTVDFPRSAKQEKIKQEKEEESKTEELKTEEKQSKIIFPQIDNEKFYGVIVPHLDKLLVLTGNELLAFYIIIREIGYNIRLHDDWKQQANNLSEDFINLIRSALANEGIRREESEVFKISLKSEELSEERKTEKKATDKTTEKSLSASIYQSSIPMFGHARVEEQEPLLARNVQQPEPSSPCAKCCIII